jgi:hypothetical protein
MGSGLLAAVRLPRTVAKRPAAVCAAGEACGARVMAKGTGSASV